MHQCREELEDSFDVCWNCGTSKEGVEDPEFRKADDVLPEPEETAPQASDLPEEREKNPINCVRCNRKLDYMGTKAFHEGRRWGALGDIGELFVNKETFDVYCCPRCGRVEFFVNGIGERFRPH